MAENHGRVIIPLFQKNELKLSNFHIPLSGAQSNNYFCTNMCQSESLTPRSNDFQQFILPDCYDFENELPGTLFVHKILFFFFSTFTTVRATT